MLREIKLYIISLKFFRRFFTTEPRIQSQGTLCGIYGDQTRIGRRFFRAFGFPISVILYQIPTTILT